MKRLICLVLLVIISLGLYTNNPTKDDFRRFVEETFRKEFTINSSEKNILTSFLSNVTSSIAGRAASSMATRDDYYLFSIYSVDIMDAKIKFIGIFNRFFPLQGLEEVFSKY